MTTSPTRLSCLALLCTLSLAACSRPPLSGPPQIRLGRDECAHCGMIINNDACSCALLVEDASRRDYLRFDDIGCMLDLQADGVGTRRIICCFVHDHATRLWLDANTATMLLADPARLPTPMGSGIAAFASPSSAQSTLTSTGGTLYDIASISAARLQWRADHLHAPTGSPPPP